jgi:hypothetical protein
MLHRHASHNEAVARIARCISERSIGVITGEVGAGKTVSVRAVLAGLDPSRHYDHLPPQPHDRDSRHLRGDPRRLRPAALPPRLPPVHPGQQGPARRTRGTRPHPVLVLDEAHLLAYEQLEMIRMLGNTSMDQDSPLACLLVGQPTLRRTMKLAVLAALEQRIAPPGKLGGAIPSPNIGTPTPGSSAP